jgi:epoxyqueuosine reductase
MEEKIRGWADRRGYRVSWFDAPLLTAALREIFRLSEDGSLEGEFFKEVLAWMDKPEITAQTGSRAVILAAVPRPAHAVTFDFHGTSHDLILPPTYHDYTPLFEEVRRDLGRELERPGSLAILKGPLKTLAVWSGLARYGRNNITYVDGFGSYHQLVGMVADFPLDASGVSGPGGPRALDECEKCRACRIVCPSGAIGEDRFLLHGERCLTYFSELEGPLPEAYAHLKRRCLVGCLVCQEVCPANPRPLPVEPLGVRFDEGETAFILGDGPGAPPPPGLEEKVESLKTGDCQMAGGVPNAVFRRNLSAVLKYRPAPYKIGLII